MKKKFYLLFVFLMVFSLAFPLLNVKADSLLPDYNEVQETLKNVDINKELDNILEKIEKTASLRDAESIKIGASDYRMEEKYGEYNDLSLNEKREYEFGLMKELLRVNGYSFEEAIEKYLEDSKTKFDLNLQSKVRDGVDEIFGLDASTYSVVPSDPSIVKGKFGDRAIALAVNAYFDIKGYNFSSLLLSRALFDNNSDEFIPTNEEKNFLYNTIAYDSLRRKDRYPAGSTKKENFKIGLTETKPMHIIQSINLMQKWQIIGL